MKFLFLTVLLLGPVAFASYDMRCTVPYLGQVHLNIEADDLKQPEHWKFEVNAKEPFSREPVTLIMKQDHALVTVVPEANRWQEFRFTYCDGDGKRGWVDIGNKYSKDAPFVAGAGGRCSCSKQ